MSKQGVYDVWKSRIRSYGIDDQRYGLAMKVLYPEETFTSLKDGGGLPPFRKKTFQIMMIRHRIEMAYVRTLLKKERSIPL